MSTAFGCCGGNDDGGRTPARPQHHCSDCPEHPWAGEPDPQCITDPPRCPHAAPARESETVENAARHLQEVRNILSAMWWRFAEAGDVEHRDQTNACLGAVIAAQATMEAADAYIAHPTKATRAALAQRCRRRSS